MTVSADAVNLAVYDGKVLPGVGTTGRSWRAASVFAIEGEHGSGWRYHDGNGSGHRFRRFGPIGCVPQPRVPYSVRMRCGASLRRGRRAGIRFEWRLCENRCQTDE